RNYREALGYAERALPLRAAFQGQVAEIDFCFFHALALIAQGGTLQGTERDRLLVQARSILDQLERWAESCPANFRHKALLVRAELASVENREEGITCYDEAAECAMQAGYPHHAALAKELAGGHFRRQGQSDLAQRYLAEA